MGSWLPIELTQMAHNVDSLFYIMLGVVAFFFVVVEGLLITFLIRYRRTAKNKVGVNVHGNIKLEIVWTLIPAIILVFLGAYSVKDVYALQNPPANPITIQVIGHEWHWEFKYPNGADSKVLKIPAGQPVKFDITSADVIHGFYIPDMRIQQDALPGRITYYWAQAKTSEVGTTFDIPCDQYCGLHHSTMIAKGEVLSPQDFQTWMQTTLQQQKQTS